MSAYKKFMLLPVVLNLFDGQPNTQTTTTDGLTDEMKVYYSDYLIDLVEPELVHDMFAQKHPIPKNGGKTIEFRQWDTLPEMTTPLTEGVTPDGQSLSMSTVTATVEQYGGYVTLSDMFMLTAIDPVLIVATKAISSQAGRSLDTISREVLNSGTIVQYAEGQVSDRTQLAYTNETTNHNLTPRAIKMAVRFLESQDAPKIDGWYGGIIHPYCKFDLTNDEDWRKPHEYVDTENIYENEIGELYGVRFVQSSRAKKFEATPLTAGSKNLTVKTAIAASTTTVAVKEAITSADATALAGMKVLLGAADATIASATAGAAGSATLTLTQEITTLAADTVITAANAGAGGVDVYSTLIMGADAYGTTEVTGGGLQHIVKQLGSGGTGDPLNQRATCGWKATKVTELLVPQYIVRIETTATP